MRELKVSIYKKEDDGSTAIFHMQWDVNHDSETKKEFFNKLISFARETNVKMHEIEDHLKELRK